VIAARADVSNITACLIPMGVWCDPVRNQLRENGCDIDLADSHDRTTERISPDDTDDETTIVSVIRRWIHLYLDFGRLMGVAVRVRVKIEPENS
jgi:hypothetical protein